MADSETNQGCPGTPAENLGLLANGGSGAWEVSVDETISGAERWFAQIEGPSISISFEIPSPSIVANAVSFLAPLRDKKQAPRSFSSSDDRLMISKDEGIPVSLVRDDEYEDRCFMVVGPGDSPIVRFTFAGEDLRDLVEALRQVEQESDETGEGTGVGEAPRRAPRERRPSGGDPGHPGREPGAEGGMAGVEPASAGEPPAAPVHFATDSGGSSKDRYQSL